MVEIFQIFIQFTLGGFVLGTGLWLITFGLRSLVNAYRESTKP